MNKDLFFSSKTDLWATPAGFFDDLDAEFHFNLDPCATPENAKCKRYFTAEQDGLKQDWGGMKVFCNPPYGRTVGEWVKKAYEESRKPGTLVVCLLPARTDTRWFHDYIIENAKIRFVRGRLKFGDGKAPAPFPSMVVIFESGENNERNYCNSQGIRRPHF